jgi:hypothetical protein
MKSKKHLRFNQGSAALSSLAQTAALISFLPQAGDISWRRSSSEK